MLTAGKLWRLAERGAYSKIVAEVGRSGVGVSGLGPGGLELAALGLALGRASEVSYEVTPEIEGLLGRLEDAWERRAGRVSGGTVGLVIRGVAALKELCDRSGGAGAPREEAARAARLLDAACGALEMEPGGAGSGSRAMGGAGERAARAWSRGRRSAARAA